MKIEQFKKITELLYGKPVEREYSEPEKLLGRAWYCIIDSVNNPEILGDKKWCDIMYNCANDIKNYFKQTAVKKR